MKEIVMGDLHFLLLFVWTGPCISMPLRGDLQSVLSKDKEEEVRNVCVWVTRSEQSFSAQRQPYGCSVCHTHSKFLHFFYLCQSRTIHRMPLSRCTTCSPGHRQRERNVCVSTKQRKRWHAVLDFVHFVAPHTRNFLIHFFLFFVWAGTS